MKAGAMKGPTSAGPHPPSGGETAGERRLRRGAELVLAYEPLTGPAPLPDFARLVSARSRRGSWRLASRAAGVVAVAAGVAAVLAVVWLRGLAPVSYVVSGQATAVVGTRIVAARAGEDARLRFSEGTEVTLVGPGAELDVVRRTARGALLALERGQARFSVAHRPAARWTVVAGPFAIEVVGTEFTVDWAPEAGRLAVDLHAGGVRVRGASVGGAVELHAGERLVATAADHRVTLSPGGEAARGLGAAGNGEAARSPGAASPVATAVGLDTAGARQNGASAAPGGAGGPTLLAPPPTPVEPSRVVVGASSATGTDHARELALWSPREGSRREGSRRDGNRIELPEQRVPTLGGAGASPPSSSRGSAERSRTGPLADLGPAISPVISPVVAAIPQSLTLGGGGLFCVTVPAQYTFEQPAAGVGVAQLFTLAFSSPRLDRSHSWCGESSVRVDATFNDDGRQNFFGRFAKETGQLLIRLDHPTDLTGRTVTMHVFVEGPWDARFSAELAAVDHGRWVSNQASRGLTPGRWWTVTHHFGEDNASGIPGSSNPWPYPNGGRSSVSEVDRLALAIRTTGELRTWKGAVFVDDISWK